MRSALLWLLCKASRLITVFRIIRAIRVLSVIRVIRVIRIIRVIIYSCESSCLIRVINEG